MRNQFSKAISKKAFTLSFLALVFTGMSLTGFAADPDTNTSSIKGAEITYQGVQGQKVAFNVNYKNESAVAFELTIKNDFNEVLYYKRFDAKPLNTTVLFSELPENCKLTFFIKTGKKELTQAFRIKSQITTVEEFVVKGL